VAEFVRDSKTRVLCLGGEWGSIPFYLGRTDSLVDTHDWLPEEYRSFLSTCPRYLLVLRHKRDLEIFHDYLVPPGRKVIQLLDVDGIGLAFVEREKKGRGGQVGHGVAHQHSDGE